jgi:hypothetical protein
MVIKPSSGSRKPRSPWPAMITNMANATATSVAPVANALTEPAEKVIRAEPSWRHGLAEVVARDLHH